MLLCLGHHLRCPINEASEIDLFSSYDFRFLIFELRIYPIFLLNLHVKPVC
jgi:hypothetical protein